ncbi:MAG TPA: bi-domain-containing oxidoreductase [Anaerolineaceae bacterium]|nr:bi-domain-containing oxidoreductase [Anaerolineaceae bacterium]
MKQLLQNLRTGETAVVDVPIPQPRPKTALVQTSVSLISVGTERMLVEFAEKNLIEKARSRPDLVRQALDKARREGVGNTLGAVFNRLDQPMALGYSSAGTIVAVGEGLQGFRVGDRVACAGGSYAVHAEYAVVPQNLMAAIPEGVDFESAAFTTLGAIALQGFRLSEPQVGERIAVIGLGLLGLLTVGIARAAGCAVFGVDLDPRRVELARQMGATAVERAAALETGNVFSRGRGCDAVLICADTRSSDPIELAGELARDRARVVAVGAVGLEVPRKVYYEKELTLRISRSYGPGRYDPAYEESGSDYPLGYVRWTEGRNLEAILDLIATGKLDVHPLITQRFPIDEASAAYELITGKSKEAFLGVLLTYPEAGRGFPSAKIPIHRSAPGALDGEPGLGVLGAGNYAGAVFLPTVQGVGMARRVGIASGTGLSAGHMALRFGFGYATSQESEILDDPAVNVVAVLTRHQDHARQVLACLGRGKAVFCEKPLAINPAELAAIQEAVEKEGSPLLTVGFNRRFAPLAKKLKAFYADAAEPMVIQYRVNAGYLPASHWLHDPQQGGGRMIGEGCHFVDFMAFLVGEPPVSVSAMALPDVGRYREDNLVAAFTFANGSIGTLSYLANGDKSFPKERVECFCSGRVAVLDDFRSLETVQNGRRTVSKNRLGQDKGHRAAWEAFLTAVKASGPPPIPYSHLLGVTRATFAAVESLRAGGEHVQL